jgi:cyclic pyranopterin phosphate synthase
MLSATAARVAANEINKGDVLGTARFAGVQAAKLASSLLPLSHPVIVSRVSVDFVIGDTYIDVEASVDGFDHSGVEMEALTTVTVTALTIYDMCKSADRTMMIGDVALWERSGGRQYPWHREMTPDETTIDEVQ